MFGWASRPGWSSSATSLGRGRRKNAVSSATPRTSRRAFNAIAAPDSVVIAEGTRRLLGNLFELPTSAPRTSRASLLRRGPGRRCARVPRKAASRRCIRSGLTALVGREEEFELLLRRWSKAKDGEGQVVLLSGEAGIGKSRLTAALFERLSGEPHTKSTLFLLAAAHRQRALPDHRTNGTRRRFGARRCAASEARQARCGARADLDLDRGRHAICRDAFAPERRPLSRTRSDAAATTPENAGSAHFASGRADTRKSGADDLRRRALDRPHQPGSARPDASTESRDFACS